MCLWIPCIAARTSIMHDPGQHTLCVARHCSTWYAYHCVKLLQLSVLACRRRRELSDELVLALADPAWAMLDLSGCSALRAGTVAAVLARLSQCRVLDLSSCTLTNQIVYGMPAWVPELQHLRLAGPYPLVERAAWQALVPALDVEAALSWEEDAADSGCRLHAVHMHACGAFETSRLCNLVG